jgi:hypothetical protein
MSSQPETSTQEVLAGLVERVTFYNAENGFCVLRAKARGHRDLVTVVGHAATIAGGEWITASDEWVNDRVHGQQFKGPLPAHIGTEHRRRHREISRLRHVGNAPALSILSTVLAAAPLRQTAASV